MTVGAEEHDPPTSPTRSPNVTFRVAEEDEAPAVTRTEDRPAAWDNTGFFENELRGYRLLKAAKLSAAERQHVMTLTKNSTHFQLIRRALRSLFADGSDGPEEAGGRHPRRTVWYADDASWDQWDNEQWADDGEDWWDEEAYWNDWSPASTWEYYDEDYEFAGGDQVHPGDEGVELTAEEKENEKRLEEAFVLAGEANRTLAEAKQAVAKVRAARGYYSPMGMKGKGRSSKGKKGGSNGKGKGPGGGTMGPCFICGMTGHGYQKCPDRWSSGKGKGSPASSPSSSRGSPFGKGKGKAGKSKKGTAYFVDYDGEAWCPEVYVCLLYTSPSPRDA